MPRPGPNVTSDADTQPGSDSLFPTGFSGGGALVRSGSVGTGEIADGSVAAADLNLSSVATALAARGEFTGTYASIGAARQIYSLRGATVGTNCWALGNPDAGGSGSTIKATAQTSRVAHYCVTDAGDLRLVYQAIKLVNPPPAEADADNTLTIKASIEYSGTIYRVTFGGLVTGICDPGGTLTSDPIGLDIPAGTLFFTRTYVSGANTGWFANTRTYTGGPGGSNASDLTAPGSAAISNSTSFLYGPSAIIGTPKAPIPTIAIIADSIGSGRGDLSGGSTEQYAEITSTNTQAGGFILRALGTLGYGRVHVGVSSGRAVTWANTHQRTLPLTNGCTHAISQVGVNDIFSAVASLASAQASLISVWKLLAARGMKVWQTTITPQTNSTDSWATLANQTSANSGQEPVRTALNDWIRAGAPVNTSLAAVTTGASGAILAGAAGHPLTGYFEVADVAESSRNSGKWVVNGTANYATTDGVHPTTAIHTLMAGAIDKTKFVLV